TALRDKTDVDEEIIQSGVRNLVVAPLLYQGRVIGDRKSTRLNSSHVASSYAVFCLKKKKSCRRNRRGPNPRYNVRRRSRSARSNRRSRCPHHQSPTRRCSRRIRLDRSRKGRWTH